MTNNCNRRRTVLKGIFTGGFVMIAGTTRVSARKLRSEGTGMDDPFSYFYVEGIKTTQIAYRPEEFVVKIRYQSPGLKRRYGMDPPFFEEKMSFVRYDAEEDNFPEHGGDTFTEDWTTYLATEDEWREINRQGPSALHSHDEWWENQHPYICSYQYKKGSCSGPSPGNCIFYTTSPINVVFDFSDAYLDIGIDQVFDEFHNEGWYSGYDINTCEYTRYAWNYRDERFEAHHRSGMSRKCGVKDDRFHVRYWEFGDFVSMQAHIDEKIFHNTISYDQAENEIRRIFDDAGWDVGSKYHYNINEPQDPDHNGYATRITRW